MSEFSTISLTIDDIQEANKIRFAIAQLEELAQQVSAIEGVSADSHVLMLINQHKHKLHSDLFSIGKQVSNSEVEL